MKPGDLFLDLVEGALLIPAAKVEPGEYLDIRIVQHERVLAELNRAAVFGIWFVDPEGYGVDALPADPES